MQAEHLPRINKRVGFSKAVQDWIFQKLIVKNQKSGKISKNDKPAGCNKVSQVGNFQKVNDLCSTFIIYFRVLTLQVPPRLGRCRGRGRF